LVLRSTTTSLTWLYKDAKGGPLEEGAAKLYSVFDPYLMVFFVVSCKLVRWAWVISCPFDTFEAVPVPKPLEFFAFDISSTSSL
jgi:hypothetical protein